MIKPLTILCLLGSFSSALWAAEPVSPQPATPLTYENPAYHKVVPAQAREMMRKGVVVIDVRMPVERLKEGFIKGSVNVPLPYLKPGAVLSAQPDLNQPVLVHCRSGVRAEAASKILIETGYKHVYNMYGTLQWPFGLLNAAQSKQ